MRKLYRNCFACFITIISLTNTLKAQQTVGLFQFDSGTTDGYTLFAPLTTSTTFLIDNCGREVHRWESSFTTASAVYLREDGLLLHTCYMANPDFATGGLSGRVELLDWDGNVTWHYTMSDSLRAAHHDAYPLPNGNILLTVWEHKDSLEAIANGRNPSTLSFKLWPDALFEVEPTTPSNGNIVWEWHVWDHLVQDYDSTKANYGVVADHPELFNLNYYNTTSKINWMHVNGLGYNAASDQIALSSHRFGEIWVIDHSTTTAEAASHSGGLRGKGGDILYRYGNPEAYGRGTSADRLFYGQHHVEWVPAGDQYAGMMKVFNNGLGSPNGPFSTVDIWQPPVDVLGGYTILPGQPFGPSSLAWTYADSGTFYSNIVSSAQRLPGSHTLICEGTTGHFFEIDSLGTTLWSYVSPIDAAGAVLNQGDSITNNLTFRAHKHLPSFPGFTGHTLTPGNRLEGNPLPLPSNCQSSATADDLHQNPITIAPNPFHDYLEIHTLPNSKFGVEVIDLQGRIIHADERIKAGDRIQTSEWPAGIYFVHFKGGRGTFKVVKQ